MNPPLPLGEGKGEGRELEGNPALLKLQQPGAGSGAGAASGPGTGRIHCGGNGDSRAAHVPGNDPRTRSPSRERTRSRSRLFSKSPFVLAALLWTGCSAPPCGPTTGVVASVSDGDTITLESGEKVRYLMVDTPETSGTAECYGPEARTFNQSLVVGRAVTLRYDQECTDRFERLLAYVSVDGREVNTLLVERGFACVLHLPPNGDDRLEEYQALQAKAQSQKQGLWGACATSPCG
ncbi:MAG: thermonuclease family protein [Myxococcota bacterium]